MLSHLFKKSNKVSRNEELGYFIYVVTSKSNETNVIYLDKRYNNDEGIKIIYLDERYNKDEGLKIIHADCEKNHYELKKVFFEETAAQRNHILKALFRDYK